MKCIYLSLMIVALLFGCAPFVPVQDLSKVPAELFHEAYKIKTFSANSFNTHPEISQDPHPEVSQYLGDITAYSCKFLTWDPPASKGNALTQLRLKALELNADGIINVTFDARGTDVFGTNCWETVQASGAAVKFKK